MRINVKSEVPNVESYESQKKYLKEVNIRFLRKQNGEYHYKRIKNMLYGECNSVRRFDKDIPIVITEGACELSVLKANIVISLKEVKRMFKDVNTISEAHEKYTNAINRLKILTNDRFNLYRYKNINNFIRDTFYKSIQDLGIQNKLEGVREYELQPLNDASKGALMKATKGKYSIGYQYDMKSSYPYSMTRHEFKLPITCGTYRTLKQEYFETNIKNNDTRARGTSCASDLRVGLYNCKAIGDSPYFLKGKSNWFTHDDLINGYKQGIHFELVSSINNAIVWLDKECMRGDELFMKYVMYFYKLKNETKCPLIKRLLSGLWGALSQKRVRTQTIQITNNHTEIKCDNPIDSIVLSDENSIDLTKYKKSLFYSSFARIKPFLLAYQRRIMYEEVIQPLLNTHSIIKIMNDSIIVDKRVLEWDACTPGIGVANKDLEITTFDSNKTLGKMVFEKEYHDFEICNLRKILSDCTV